MPLDTDDEGDASLPVWLRDGVSRSEHGDVARFLPIASGVDAGDATLLYYARAEPVDPPVHGWLFLT